MKKTFYIIWFSMLLAANAVLGQIVQFANIYEGPGYDFGYSVTQTADGGYAVAGSTSNMGNGSADAYLLKTDDQGVFLWHKTYGGINIDQAYSIAETKDTGFVIAGFTNSFGKGGYDIYVIKTDRNGDTIWTKTYGGTNWDFGYSVKQTSDGGYIITGGTYSFGNGFEDMYLIKINSVGDTLWTKTYGGAKEEEARSVIQTKDGGYILTGFTKSYADSTGDFFTVKTNNMGDTLWTNKYGGQGEDAAFEVLERYAGGYAIGGKTKSSGFGNSDGLIIELSALGIVTYNANYGGPDDDGINSIKLSPGGRLGMAGYTYSFGKKNGATDGLLYIQNPVDGLHSATFGGNNMDKAFCINKTKDNGYIICGSSNSFSSVDQIFLIKTDSNGVAPATPAVTITGISSITKTNTIFKIYPNPANQNFHLLFNDETISNHTSVTITITDVFGKNKIQNIIRNISSEPFEINTTELNPGIYIINIKDENYSINQKLIVEH